VKLIPNCFFILILFIPLAYAQSIPITKSDRMDQVIFDVKFGSFNQQTLAISSV